MALIATAKEDDSDTALTLTLSLLRGSGSGRLAAPRSADNGDGTVAGVGGRLGRLEDADDGELIGASGGREVGVERADKGTAGFAGVENVSGA